MKNQVFILMCLGSLTVLWADPELADPELADPELSLSGKSYFVTGAGISGNNRTFENWTDLHGEYGNFGADLHLTAFEPAPTYSQDTSHPGISFASLDWNNAGQEIRVGHFYDQMGNGITLRSYRDYTICWDNSLLGMMWNGSGNYWKANVFTGEPRDLTGARYAPVSGGELDLLPIKSLSLGLTGAETKGMDSSAMQWGSALGKLSWYGTDFGGSLKGEYALRNQNPNAFAGYLATDLLLGPLSFVGEFKDYLGFDINNGAPLNNAPYAAKEHTFTLMSRKELQATAQDIIGWTTETAYKLPFESQEWILRASTTYAKDHEGDPLFNEYYGQIEFNKNSMGIILGGGYQWDAEETHYNLVYSGNYPLSENFFLKTIFEHQQAIVHLSQEAYYDQIYRLTLTMYRTLGIGVVGEQLVQNVNGVVNPAWWPGLQVDYHLNDKSSLTFFGGMRRAGKDCSGGICVAKPEFNGIEVVGNLTF